MIKLKAEKREKKQKKANSAVYGVVYGKHIEDNILVALDSNSIEKVYDEFGTSNIIALNVDGEEVNVLIKDIQVDPMKNFISHVDFYAVTKGEAIEVEVPFDFIGESEAVNKGAVMSTITSDVTIKTTPSKIPSSFEIDLSALKQEGDVIKLSDVILPEGVELVVENPDEIVIVSVAAAKEEVEEEPEVQATETAEADNTEAPKE